MALHTFGALDGLCRGQPTLTTDKGGTPVTVFSVPMIVDAGNPSHYRQLSPVEMPVLRAGTSGATAMKEYRKVMNSFGAPAQTVPSVFFTRDGCWLASTSADGQLDFFDATTGNRLPFRIPTETGQRLPPLSLAASGRYSCFPSERKQGMQTVETSVRIPTLFRRKDFHALAIASDGGALAAASAGGQLASIGSARRFGVDIYDANSGKIMYSLPDAAAEAGALAFSPNGRSIIGADHNGALSIWRRSDGALLGELRALQEGEWLVHTPSGLFDGSPRAWSLISWHDSDRSLDPAAGEIYFNEFYTPGLLADLLDGRQPKAARTITSIDRRQPTITITAAENLEGGASIRITVTEAAASVSAAKGSGVRDLRLFRNGQLIKAWRGNLQLDRDGHVSVETTAKLTAGPNRFSAYAFNSDNIKSADAEAVVTRPGGPAPGVAYVLTIGVNEYANPEFNLKYAAPDADAVAAGLIERQKGLNQFSEIRSIDLRNGQATRANIMLALKRLAGEDSGPLPADAPQGLREVRAIEPEDTLILYFAGHGIASGDRFYLVPHDLGFSGPRSEIRANISEILKHGISDQDLERALEPIDARHMVLIIDACQSGQALESDDDRRGPMNSRGLAQLAWEKGISILAASQAYQAALESSQFGHGYLTFALTQEGLRTPVADSAPADGVITETEWLEYAARRVPQLQIEAMEKAREDGRKLTLEIVTDNAASARLQSPRLFTRRDAPGAPLIVAKYK